MCMTKNGFGDSCFETVTLSQVLELIQGLDTTEVRAAKMLDSKDLDKLHLLKQSLIVICLIYLNRDTKVPNEEVKQFLSYILLESKVIRTELKSLVLLPIQNLANKDEMSATNYFSKVRA